MKILFVTQKFPPYVSGGYEQITGDAAVALRERGHDVSVLTGMGVDLEGKPGILPWLDLDLDTPGDLFDDARNLSIPEKFARHFFGRKNYKLTRRAIRAEKPDLVAFWNLTLLSLAPLFAARHERVPSVTYLSDPWLCNAWYKEWKEFSSAKPLRDRIVRGILRVTRDLFLAALRPSHLIVPSHALWAEYREEGFRGEPWRIIPHGVSPSLARFLSARQPRRGERRPGEPLRVLFVGYAWEGKGLHVLLEALHRLQVVDGFEDFTCDVYGGAYEPYLVFCKSYATGAGIADRVRFRGKRDRPALAEAYESCDVLVFPSIWNEPFALVPIEAMAFGCTILASTAGGTPEAIRDGEEGLLVPPSDAKALAAALLRLEGDPALRRRLGEAARRRAFERYTFGRFLDELEQACADAAGEGRGRPLAAAAGRAAS